MNKSIIISLLVLPVLLTSCASVNSSSENSKTTFSSTAISSSKEVKISSIETNYDDFKILYAKAGQIVATPYPLDATNKNLEYEITEGKGKISVNWRGEVVGTGIGKAEVTIKAKDGSGVSKKVNVEVVDQYREDEAAFYRNESPINNEEYFREPFAPTTGKQKILVIPVKFSVSDQFYSNESLYLLNKAYNGTTEECGGLPSVHEYFLNASKNLLDITATVANQWYIPPDKYTLDYIKEDHSAELVQLALDWYKRTYDKVDMSEFDTDNDGIIDQIHIVPNFSSPSHAYMSQVPNDTINKTGLKVYCYAYIPYAYLPNFHRVPDGVIDTHTFIHETGHMFGLMDYYDPKKEYSFLGDYDMQSQDYMDWNCFSKYSVGWAKPYYVDEDYLKEHKSAKITLSSGNLNNDCLILRKKGGLGHAFEEYILIELFNHDAPNNYYDTHYNFDNNANFLKYGVKIFHIDARVYQDYFNEEFDHVVSEFITKENENRPGTTNRHFINTNMGIPGFREDESESEMVFQLIQLLQKGGENTFGQAHTRFDDSARHYLVTNDLWRTGDTFCIGPHEGYKDYGEAFFTKKTVFNDGSEFPFGIVFDEVTPDLATLTINYLD